MNNIFFADAVEKVAPLKSSDICSEPPPPVLIPRRLLFNDPTPTPKIFEGGNVSLFETAQTPQKARNLRYFRGRMKTLTPRRTELIKENRNLKRKCERLKSQVKRLKGEVSTNFTGIASKQKLLEGLAEHLDPLALSLVSSQINSSNVNKKGFRYSIVEKEFAISIYISRPSTYKLLRSIFRKLPHKRSILRWLENVPMEPGYNEGLVNLLEKSLLKKSELEKTVVLLFDEIMISSELAYNEKRDMIMGLEDLAECWGRTPELANQALVLMINGIFMHYKQTVGYYFSKNGMPAESLNKILRFWLTELSKIGVKVVGVVCDQHANNQKLYNTYFGVNPTKPFFYHSQQRVYTFFDSSHLIKNVRNNWQKNGILVENGETVEFTPIKHSYLIDKISTSKARLMPKLSDNHFQLNGFKSMSVKLAVQVLSHSVSSAIRTYVDYKKLPEEALKTANVVDIFDKLFDAFNSSKSNQKSLLKQPISIHTECRQTKFLKDTFEWLGKTRFAGKSSSRVKCLEGWRLNIAALMLLRQDIHLQHGDKIQWLWTRRISQDPLENSFSILRAKGGCNYKIGACQFPSIARNLMISTMIPAPSNKNCADSKSDKNILLSIGDFTSVASRPVASFITELSSFPKSDPIVFSQQEFINDGCIKFEMCGPAYIGGYVVRKILSHHSSCNSCAEKLNGKLSCSFLKHKKYSQDSKLVTPSSEMVYFVKQICDLYSENFLESRTGTKVLESLFERAIIATRGLLDDICPETKRSAMVLCGRILLFASIKRINRAIKTSQRKERKLSILIGR